MKLAAHAVWIILATIQPMVGAECTGDIDCNVCQDCSKCVHCSKEGACRRKYLERLGWWAGSVFKWTSAATEGETNRGVTNEVEVRRTNSVQNADRNGRIRFGFLACETQLIVFRERENRVITSITPNLAEKATSTPAFNSMVVVPWSAVPEFTDTLSKWTELEKIARLRHLQPFEKLLATLLRGNIKFVWAKDSAGQNMAGKMMPMGYEARDVDEIQRLLREQLPEAHKEMLAIKARR